MNEVTTETLPVDPNAPVVQPIVQPAGEGEAAPQEAPVTEGQAI